MEAKNFNINSPLEITTNPLNSVETSMNSLETKSMSKIMDKINVVSYYSKEEIDHFLSLNLLDNKENPGLITQTQIDCFFETLENYVNKGGYKKFSLCYDFSKDPDVLDVIQRTGNDNILNIISQNLVHAAY